MRNTSKIKNLNKQERPREKLVTMGIKSLTDEELLSIIIRAGGRNNSAIDLARSLLKTYKSLKNFLNVEIEELVKIKDIGIAKATSIKALSEIAIRMREDKNTTNKINNPSDVYDLMYPHLYGKEKEYLYIINLNSKNTSISEDIISIGTINETLVDSRVIYKRALAKNAVSIILVHNHPSNDPTPSIQDIKITEEVAEIGKKIGIPLVDHIIFTDSNYVSLKSLNVFNTYKFQEEMR